MLKPDYLGSNFVSTIYILGTLGKSLDFFLFLNFLLCKMGIISGFTSQGCYEGKYDNTCKALKTMPGTQKVLSKCLLLFLLYVNPYYYLKNTMLGT